MAVVPQQPALTLVVETPDGVAVREIPKPTPLVAGVERGAAAEVATRSAVARWGLPDFVYRPVIRQVDSGARELGDAVILVRNRAVVVQVKSRSLPETGPNKEEHWVTKAATKALRQGRGTVRSLRSAPATFVNMRNREVTVDGRDFEWLTLVIIDHPAVPRHMKVVNPFADLPAVVLTRRDWEFLFEQLRSTHAVVEYLFRIAAETPEHLGEEPVRYYHLAQADEDTPPEAPHPSLVGEGTVISAPLLPKIPAGHGDERLHSLLRILMEDIATSPLPENVAELERIRILAEIDQLPVQHRTEMARAILSMMRDVCGAPERQVMWRLRRIRFAPGKPHLMFAACNKSDGSIRRAFSTLVTLRHCEFGQDLGSLEGLTTVGVLLTPRRDGVRPWDTTMNRISGDPHLEPDELEEMRTFWLNSRLEDPKPPRPRKKWTAKAKGKPKKNRK